MKRQYLLYVMLLPIAYVLYTVHKGYSTESPFFYGFAENKETELSHESNILVKEILVSQGEEVTEGQVLMIVSNADLSSFSEAAEWSTENSALKFQIKKTELNHKISIAETAIVDYENQIQNEITEINLKINQNREILEAINQDSKEVFNNKQTLHIEMLQDKLASYRSKKNAEVINLKEEIANINRLKRLQREKSESRISEIKGDFDKLKILAPADGVIGNIPTRRGENVKAYTTLLTFYEQQPTRVKGYVHENLLVHVSIGDSLLISSTLRPENTIQGSVIGLGSRIVEIPGRLRKNPTIKSYGREVIVAIPSNNSFLQKEKVSINSEVNTSYKNNRALNSKIEKLLKEEMSIK